VFLGDPKELSNEAHFSLPVDTSSSRGDVENKIISTQEQPEGARSDLEEIDLDFGAGWPIEGRR